MKRIIIVDDDPAIRDAFVMIFNSEEYDVTVYPDAAPVLDHSFNLPDLFILDKQLSGVDGIDLCRILKEQKETKHIPVIMLSASPNIKSLANAAGADDVLEKPFRIKTLLESVGRLLERDGSGQK
jgi:DNA-binding response OmpR family regulator